MSQDPASVEIAEQTQDRTIGLEHEMTPPPLAIREDYVGSGKLAGKKALITGGDSGIGRAVAVHYAREGADVAFVHLPEEDQDAAETVRLVQAEGVTALAMAGDISDRAFCEDAVARTVAELGGLDVLVSNASKMQGVASLTDVTDEHWLSHFDVNVHGMFYVTRAALPHLQAGSAIICTTSVNAFAGAGAFVAYTATKAAIVGFVRSMALQLVGSGVRVNEVAPGPTYTPIQPAGFPADQVPSLGEASPTGRMGQPAELGPAYVYLASQDSSYVTGQTIHVNGGMIVNG